VGVVPYGRLLLSLPVAPHMYKRRIALSPSVTSTSTSTPLTTTTTLTATCQTVCDLYDDLRRDAVELFTLMKVVRTKEAQLKALREGGDPQQGTWGLPDGGGWVDGSMGPWVDGLAGDARRKEERASHINHQPPSDHTSTHSSTPNHPRNSLRPAPARLRLRHWGCGRRARDGLCRRDRGRRRRRAQKEPEAGRRGGWGCAPWRWRGGGGVGACGIRLEPVCGGGGGGRG
jgi:hypothetical protein